MAASAAVFVQPTTVGKSATIRVIWMEDSIRAAARLATKMLLGP
jgi:hypothetical protein